MTKREALEAAQAKMREAHRIGKEAAKLLEQAGIFEGAPSNDVTSVWYRAAMAHDEIGAMLKTGEYA